MKLDERARVARNRAMQELDGLAVPAATDVLRRHVARRRRRLVMGSAALTTLVVAVAAASIVAVRPGPGPGVETVAPFAGLPAEAVVDGAWAAVPKGSAGIGSSASLNALVATGDSFVAGGTGLWRSSDGLQWVSVAPPSFTGEISALGSHGDDVFAIASAAGTSSVVLRSNDDGRTWTVIAQRQDLFGPPAPAMGRPFVESLRWSDAGFWIAAGGAPDGYAGIWTSRDGTDWESVLGSGNGAGSVEIVDDGTGGLLAHFLNQAWASQDGAAWTPVELSVPGPYVLTGIGPSASIAVGADPAAPHTSPTALLRSSDHGRTWTEDATFGTRFDAPVGWTIQHDGTGWVIAGSSGGPRTQHADAWISPDSINWSAMPQSLKEAPGGTLDLVASVKSTTVIMGGAPELDRYFVIDHRLSTADAVAPSTDSRNPLLDLPLGHDHLGPVQVGMTVEQAEEALGEDVVEKETGSGCDLYRPISTPHAIEFRVDDGRIFTIQAVGVASEAGVAVGDVEDAINEAYADESVLDVSLPAVRRVLVRPAPNSAHATVFVLESGGTVSSMRAGTYPEVEQYEEGCP
jgi:hypothetical protein